MSGFPGYIEATPARGYIVHLVPASADGSNITTYVASCGWQPKPSGLARPKWYPAGNYNPRHRCPRCFPDVPTTDPKE